MATKPIPTFVCFPNPSIPSTKTPFHICSKPFKSSLTSSTTLSRPASFAIKCINDNANTSSDPKTYVRELRSYLASIPEGIPNTYKLDNMLSDLLKCDETRVLLDGLSNLTKGVVEPATVKKQQIKMKKMKRYINQLETRVAEIEKCQKELSEARALVEEANRFLHVEFGDQNSMKSETESCKSKKVATISDIVDALTDLLLH